MDQKKYSTVPPKVKVLYSRYGFKVFLLYLGAIVRTTVHIVEISKPKKNKIKLNW